ncbi:LURP-one-related/scramblase family protein [Vagococcus hydrophili]|uniref:Uncharacterized protein n=1 Tax=Vagococcus hydrophili TaxID=2714947 RepID=A0A6G8ARP0_9ENTE|nr:hypothetical protein [Vagococcus hydrophili]QIL47748.1 hypothetical protein G7082_03935 [Vagococcus hydrophili]
MKQLIMKQGETSIRETTTVVNRKGKEEYTVIISSEKDTPKITVKTIGKEIVAVVKEVEMGAEEKYIIEVDNEVVFNVEKEMLTHGSNYIVESKEMHTEGYLSKMSFEIMLGYRKVAKVRKRWIATEDSYELTIFEPENELSLVALLSLLDFVNFSTVS